jgi:hypothetical protein
MSKRAICVAITFALVAPVSIGASAEKSPKLAKCDGKKRRPANPYGSILPTVDPQNGTSTPAGQPSGRRGVDVFPQPQSPAAKPANKDGKPAAEVPPIGRLDAPAASRSC